MATVIGRIILSSITALIYMLVTWSTTLAAQSGNGLAPRSVRLLLVDRRTILRRGLRTALEGQGDIYVVGESGHMSEVLTRAAELQPDVVLIGMHAATDQIDDIVSSLKNLAPGAQVVILLPPSADSQVVYEAIRAGVRGCVNEESGIPELVDTIHAVAQGRVVLTSEYITCLVNLLSQSTLVNQQQVTTQRLSPREQEVLEMISTGRSNRDIARSLQVAESTVRSHVHNILAKLDMSSRVQAAVFMLGTNGHHSGNRTPKTGPNKSF